jgi:hypothetical protein
MDLSKPQASQKTGRSLCQNNANPHLGKTSSEIALSCYNKKLQ